MYLRRNEALVHKWQQGEDSLALASEAGKISGLRALVYATVDARGFAHAEILVLVQCHTLAEALLRHPAQQCNGPSLVAPLNGSNASRLRALSQR